MRSLRGPLATSLAAGQKASEGRAADGRRHDVGAFDDAGGPDNLNGGGCRQIDTRSARGERHGARLDDAPVIEPGECSSISVDSEGDSPPLAHPERHSRVSDELPNGPGDLSGV